MPTLLDRGNREGSRAKDRADCDSEIVREGVKSIVAQDSTGQTTSSLDSPAEEVSTAGGLNAVVQPWFILQDQAVVDARGIGVVGHECYVRCHDVPRAARAESGGVGGGLKEQEGEVGCCKGSGVGNECCRRATIATSNGVAIGEW